MAKSDVTLGEALALLQKALSQLGLERFNITVSCHGLTTEEAPAFAQGLLASGFGEKVTESSRSHEYTHRPGKFSWLTVAQENIQIDLFYDLEEAS